MTEESPENTSQLVERSEQQRFEMAVDGDTAFMRYRRAGNKLHLLHTEVPEAWRGRGLGARLVELVLEQARAEGSVVVAHCPYVKAFLEKHPEYRELTQPRGAAS